MRLRIQVLVLAVAVLGAALYFGGRGDGAAIRNDSLAFDLENLFLEVEERTLAVERALLRADEDGLRLSLTEDASCQVPTPFRPSALEPLGQFEPRILGTDSVENHAGRDAVVGAWGRYLAGYRVVTDVRFKLKTFVADQAWERRADAIIALEVRGVLLSGETVQDEVKYSGVLVREAHEWLLRDLTMQQRALRLTPERLFTQVTQAAGREMHISDQFNVQGPFILWDRDNPRKTTNLDYGGIACADVDGDGRLDVYVASAQGTDYLFLNQGDGKFEDATDDAGVGSTGGSRGAVFADIDNDGDQDLFVTKATFHVSPVDPSSNQLFRNDGRGRFTDVTAESGLELVGECFTPTFLDYDLDGDLDLYICRYGKIGLRSINYFEARNGEPNVLYRNLGDGRFEAVPGAAGAADTGWSYAVAVCDYDSDGWPDIYVANDYGPNRLYRNNGAGGFEETQQATGVTDNGNGMGAAWVDINDDGRFDLYVTNMSSDTGNRILSAAPIADERKRESLLKFTQGNSFFVATADGTFDSLGEEMGVAQCGWAWHGDFLDIDRDADEDLFVVNGYITGVTEKEY